MHCSVYQAAVDRHAQLFAEAESARLNRLQGVVVLELRLPVSTAARTPHHAATSAPLAEPSGDKYMNDEKGAV